MVTLIVFSVVGLFFVVILILCIKIVPQTHRGVIETFGKFERVTDSGFQLVIPFIQVIKLRNMTERIADIKPQDIITKDNLNARVDLQVYYKVKNTIEDIKNSYYFVDDFKLQIISLAQTTARNVIGDMKFTDVNSQRNELNRKLAEIMAEQINNWGVEVVRVELKEIIPPQDVQETMNAVIQAQNKKEAAIDIATALETQADGQRRAAIKNAEGIKQSAILEAEGKAKAIELVNDAADKFFKGNAIELKKIEAFSNALLNNTKFVISEDLVKSMSNIWKG